jgi:hypothetical protein
MDVMPIFARPQLDNLLDLSNEQFMELVHARARRRFQRGLTRKPMGLIKKLRKAKKEAAPNEKPAPVKTHLRNMIIVPEMIGSQLGVYSGKVSCRRRKAQSNALDGAGEEGNRQEAQASERASENVTRRTKSQRNERCGTRGPNLIGMCESTPQARLQSGSKGAAVSTS